MDLQQAVSAQTAASNAAAVLVSQPSFTHFSGEPAQLIVMQQQRMKAMSKKLLGNKKASKLFRLGLQQLIMSQPEYFLNASRRLIGLGQYRKAFSLLRKQLPNLETFRFDFQPIFMHHFLHICHKLITKFVRNNQRSTEAEKDHSAHGHSTSAVGAAGGSLPNNQKKKHSFTIIEHINALIIIQTQNLSSTENILVHLCQESKTKSFKTTSTTTTTTTTTTAAAAAASSQAANTDDVDAPPASIEDWRIEMFSESFLFYLFSTIKIGFKHFKSVGKDKMALSLLLRGTNFIENSMDGMFGDFKGMDVYRMSADLLQMKANVYFEAQNLTAARKLYEKAFKYYHFAGQLALKKLHSYSADEVNNALELKVENTFSSFSLNIMMMAACYEQEFNYERMLDSLHTSNWINSKILQYDYSQKLRSHVTDLIRDAEAKYGVFLEEKGEIRRALLKGLPHLEELEAKASQKLETEVEMIERINNYLYEKAEVAKLNQNLILLHVPIDQLTQKSQKVKATDNNNHPESEYGSERQAGDTFIQLRASCDNLDLPGGNPGATVVLINGRQHHHLHHPGSVAGHSRRVQSSPNPASMVSLERVKELTPREIESQSFSDYFSQTIGGGGSGAGGAPAVGTSTFYTSGNPQQQHHSYSKTMLSSPSASLVYNNHTNLFSPMPSQYPNMSSFLTSPNGLTSQSLSKQNKYDHTMIAASSDTARMMYRTQASSPAHAAFRSTTPRGQTELLKGQSLANSGSNNLLKKKHSMGNLHTPMASQTLRSSQQNNTVDQTKSQLITGQLSNQQNPAKIKPKMLTTNKYFQPDLKPISQQLMTDYRLLTAACPDQEQKFHYLNLLPTKAKTDKKQGVLSLDYAMENLIKEKIIQNDLYLMQQQQAVQDRQLQQQQQQQQQLLNLSPQTLRIRGISGSAHNFSRQATTILHEETGSELGESKANVVSMVILPTSLQQQQSQQQPQSQPKKSIAMLTNDKQVGEQIRNLMNSLHIPQQDQREIIEDLVAKFESEKKSLFTSSKSKMSQQGWTTEKILNELMKSINILGENVNTYNQRFAQFLSTIKEEDFDRSEFNTCLRKLTFRKKMGNGVIPSFFKERLEPIAPIQERLNIDNEYVVIQSGGERMNELMSDHKVIKNYFEDIHIASELSSSSTGVTNTTNASVSEESQKKGGDDEKEIGLSSVEEPKAQQAVFKLKQKKVLPGKTGTVFLALSSSESNVEKQLAGLNKSNGTGENYFQKSQEALRQMVLSSEMEGEEMTKEIRNPKRHHRNVTTKSTTLAFSSFSNELASSVMPYTHRMRVQKAGKIDNFDLLKMQNKWKNTASVKSQQSSLNVGTPISSRLAAMSAIPQNKSSAFAKKDD